LFRVDALLPTALPTTTAPLPGPGTAKEVRLALKPANLPQFDQMAEREEEPPPPRAEDRVLETDVAAATASAAPSPSPAPAPPAEQPALPAAAPRKPGQWQGAYWSQRKAAAAGMPKPGSENAPEPAAPSATCAVDLLGPITLAGSERSAELAEVAAYVVLHPGCSVRQMAEELWPAHTGALEIVDGQLVRLRELLDAEGHDEQLLRVTPESVTLAPAVTCDWLEFVRRTQTGELVGALSLVRGRPFENAPLRRYGWAESLRHEMAALAIDTAHYVAEACLREQSPRNARKAALRGLAAAPESELLYRDLLTALAALGDVPAARRHADTLLDYANREALALQPETTVLLRDVVQAASRS
jgi:DNA-binding SARP family transcriptional activator